MKKSTKKGNNYWNKNAAYSKEYEELWNKYVPVKGKASTTKGEMLRCASKLTYDYYNNGNINVKENKTNINKYYLEMIEYLHRHIEDKSKVDNLVEFLKNNKKHYSTYTYSEDEERVYVELMDEVIYTVLKML